MTELQQASQEEIKYSVCKDDIPHPIINGIYEKLLILINELHLDNIPCDDIQLSIVIPAFNERKRLPKTIFETIRWCHKNLPSYEILIADDGSSDETVDIAKLFSTYIKNIRVIACPHLGKGAAVRMGMLNAVGRYVLFMDADGATPLGEIPKLMERIDNGYHIAVGSRALKDDGNTLVENRPLRIIIGRAFNFITNIFAATGIKDTQCGFKMFKKEVVKNIFLRQKVNGFAFDVEIIFLAKRTSLQIAEVPVNWFDKEGSKVHVLRDGFRMFKDILKINFIHMKI